MNAMTRLEDEYDRAHPLRTVARVYRPQRWHLLAAALAFVVKHSPVFLMPALTARVVDVVVEHRPLRELWVTAAVMAVVVAQNLPVAAVYGRQLALAVRSTETALRRGLAERLQELSIGYHRRTSAGVLQAKIVRDVENVVEASRAAYDAGLAAVVTLVGAMVLTAINVPEFLPVFALAVPASAALIFTTRRGMNQRNASFRAEVEQMSARVSEMTHLIPVTRAHALESRELDRMEGTLTRVRHAGIRLDVLNTRFGALSWTLFQLLSVVCLIGAAWVAWTGFFPVSAGDVVMLSSYFVTLIGSVTALVGLVPVVAKGLESVRSMGDVLGADEVEQNQGKRRLATVVGHVTLDHVTYSYDEPDAGPVLALDDLTLDVPAGQTVAFVGPSGSGKSTVLNTVIGFLAPRSGRVLVDGVDLATVDLRSYRSHLAVVPQESILFEGSVRDNVTYGVDVPDDAVLAALDDANALEFVTPMGGLDAVIGERGARLSGGQRQRLAIARALVRDPRVLVLDEATSALDTASERLVQEALGRLMKGRTTFVVAHRLSTVQGADRIVVMEHGRVVEAGPHHELLRAGGAYARLHGR